MATELKYAVIKFDGKVVGRVEKAYFPNANGKHVMLRGKVDIYEDE